LDILADTEVACALLDERVLSRLGYILMSRIEEVNTLAGFLEAAPAFPCGNGAGAAFFPDFGGYH
jgi:hypothetical protein